MKVSIQVIERTVVTTDNRDERTTWLHLNPIEGVNPEYVEVNPAELFRNMLENNLDVDQFDRLVNILELLVEDYRGENVHPESTKAVELLYEAVGGTAKEAK